jgi:hypothetical protein
MKKFIILITSVFPLIAFAQSGIVNNGAIIKVENGSYVVAESQFGHIKIINNGANPGKIINDGTITINGNWTNNTTYQSTTGTVVLKGTNTSINGTAITNFNNLKINKTASSNNVCLNSNIIVKSNLILTSGDLYLNNKNTNLGLNGVIQSETNSNKIWDDYINGTGTVSVTRNNITPTAGENFGNIGILITSTQNFGNTTIIRGHKQQTSASPAGSSIYRYFDITPTNNTSLDATLRFTYFDEEIPAGMSEINFALYNSANSGITWIYEAGTPNPASNYLQKTNINSFNRWTATDETIAPLPVEMLVFNALRENKTVHLFWKTLSEINNLGFDVEKSTDLNNWKKIGFIEGAGSSNTELNYKFDDLLTESNLLKDKYLYYRLKQIDFNGEIKYTVIKTIVINNEQSTEITINVFPNPSENYINIICNESEKTLFVKIINPEGVTIGDYLLKGNKNIDLSKLSPSIYYIFILDPETGSYTKKEIVKL